MRTLLLLLLIAPAFSQELAQQSFLVRLDTTTVEAVTGMTHICILVYPDGKYRLENSFQSSQGGGPDVHVYLDQLPDDILKQLQVILSDGDLQKLSTPPPHGGIIQNMDLFNLTVPRQHSIQNLSFETADQRKPYQKTLKPVFAWMKDVQKRKLRAVKGATSDNCQAPRVMYKTEFRVQPNRSPDTTQSNANQHNEGQ